MSIRQKDRDTLIQALRAGVVPNFGQHLVQVGRANEIESLLSEFSAGVRRSEAVSLGHPVIPVLDGFVG